MGLNNKVWAKKLNSFNVSKSSILRYRDSGHVLDVISGFDGETIYHGTLNLKDYLGFEIVWSFESNFDAVLDFIFDMISSQKVLYFRINDSLRSKDDFQKCLFVEKSFDWFEIDTQVYTMHELFLQDAVIYQNSKDIDVFWCDFKTDTLDYSQYWIESNRNSNIIGEVLYANTKYSVSDLKKLNFDLTTCYLGTPLIQAFFFSKQFDIVQSLIEDYNADVNIIDDYGNSILYYLLMPEYENQKLRDLVSQRFKNWDFRNAYGISVNDVLNQMS